MASLSIETIVATREQRVPRYLPEHDRLRIAPARPAPPAGTCPDAMVREIARQCDASELVAYWQGPGAELQLVGSFRSETAPRGRARFGEPVLADPFVGMPLGDQPYRVRWNGGSFTMAMPLSTGTLKLSGTVAAQDAMSRQTCLATLDPLSPLIVIFFEQWLATREVIDRMIGFSQGIDGSGVATILLGDSAAIIHANPAAIAILDQQDGLRRCDDRLVCTQYADTLRLQTAMDHFRFCQTGGGTKEFNPVLPVTRDRRRALTVALTAVRPGMTRNPEALRAVAYVFDPDQDLTDALQPACRLLGLSNSEARLACALVEGMPLKDAAARMGLQEQTARSYLKQVFAKTGTARQAELVKLMLKSAVRTAGGKGFEVIM